MKNLSERYIALRQAIIKEKEKLEQRLASIQTAIQVEGTAQKIPTKRGPGRAKTVKAKADKPPVARKKRSSGKSPTLQETVVQLLSDKPMTKKEIFDALQKSGFPFQSKNPLNSLNAALYRNANVKRKGRGLFSRV